MPSYPNRGIEPWDISLKSYIDVGGLTDAGLDARGLPKSGDELSASIDAAVQPVIDSIPAAIAGGTSAAVVACGARVNRTGILSIPNATETAIPFNFEQYDTHGFWDPAHPTRLTVPVGRAGLLAWDGALEWQDQGSPDPDTGVRGVALRKNGNSYIKQGQTITAPIKREMRQTVETPGVLLAAGDYVELTVYQDSGAARTIVAYVGGSSALGAYSFGVTMVGKS